MPLLFLLTLWGFVVALRDVAAAALRIPLLGCAAMTGGVIAFGHVAQRYTSEFVPLLALGATIGFVDIARRVAGRRIALKRSVLTVVWALAAFGIVASCRDRARQRHGSTGGASASRTSWPCSWLSPTRQAGEVGERVRFVAALPERGGVDELGRRRRLRRRYTSGLGDPRVVDPVEHRSRHVPHRRRRLRCASRLDEPDVVQRAHAASPARPGEPPRTTAPRHDRGVTRHVGTLARQPAPGDTIDVDVTGDTEANRFVATATVTGGDRQSVVTAPMSEWNPQFRTVPIVPTVALSGAVGAERIG